MNLELTETLLKLKENESIEIALVSPKLKEDNGLTVQCSTTGEFDEFTIEYFSDICTAAVMVCSLFREEITQDIKNCESNDLLNVYIMPSNKGFKVTLKSYYLNKYITDIRDEKFRAKIDELVCSINQLECQMEKHLDKVISNYLELKETGAIKEFILLYENGRDITRNDFVRLTDRPIHQQKVEIQELIDNGLTGKIYDNIIEENPELIDKKLCIGFTLVNDNEVKDIKVSTF